MRPTATGGDLVGTIHLKAREGCPAGCGQTDDLRRFGIVLEVLYPNVTTRMEERHLRSGQVVIACLVVGLKEVTGSTSER